MADCVGGVLCFDALCFSGDKRHGTPDTNATNYSTESLKVNTILRTDTHIHIRYAQRVCHAHSSVLWFLPFHICLALSFFSDIIHVCFDKHFTSCLVFRISNRFRPFKTYFPKCLLVLSLFAEAFHVLCETVAVCGGLINLIH